MRQLCQLVSALQTFEFRHSRANFVGRALLPVAHMDGQECPSYSLVAANGRAKSLRQENVIRAVLVR